MKTFSLLSSKLLAIWAFLIISTAFQIPIEEGETASPKKLITLNSDVFLQFSNSVYSSLAFDKDTLDKKVWDIAIRGYYYLKATDQLTNSKYLTVIDFTESCNNERLWVIDLENKKVEYNEMVAHGKYSGEEYAYRFSNQHRSNKSSLGFYITGGTYYGRNGLSLKLNGIEKRFNSNAYSRGIVIHGANYVGDRYLRYNDRIGRSYGCPAVSQSVNKEMVNSLKDGSCLYIYHNWKYYHDNSHIVNADLYIPMDDLSL